MRPILEFFTESNAESLLNTRYDFFVDAIDNLANKCRLIALRCDKQIPIITCGGAGGRRDPTAIRVADLAVTTHDRLLQKVRDRLRKRFGLRVAKPNSASLPFTRLSHRFIRGMTAPFAQNESPLPMANRYD